MHDVIILGSGPAGLTAAIYCGRANKSTLVLAGDSLGGQTAEIAKLENYPGWAGSGMELIQFMKKQAESFGAKMEFASATNIKFNEDGTYTIICDNGKSFDTQSVILATGARARKLEIEGANEFFGRGVSYCATCDGFFYSGRDVLVYGGGNSALNDALYLADIAKSVKIVYRKSEFFRAEMVLRDRVDAKENIECVYNTELKSIAGKPDSDKLIATTTDGREIECDGIFVAIGHEANTDYLSETIKRDNLGRIAPESLPAGMFIAGDVESNIKMQIATAVGTGCTAGMDAIAYLNTRK
ncbi:MAG: FAD-dependent oxidoreductase [Alphaproteobacteria bacterium]|nr:FAD-dependent oxidoreductase [Alphaproteobacteria bacterium]